MSDCPNIENSFKNLLYTALLKKSHHRAHTGNVDMNLSVKKEKNRVSGNFVSGTQISVKITLVGNTCRCLGEHLGPLWQNIDQRNVDILLVFSESFQLVDQRCLKLKRGKSS